MSVLPKETECYEKDNWKMGDHIQTQKISKAVFILRPARWDGTRHKKKEKNAIRRWDQFVQRP